MPSSVPEPRAWRPTAARAQGKSAVVIESGPYGTTCARVGCMPSKLLIAASEAAHMLALAPGFGVHAGQTRIDGKAVMARVRSERDRFVGFVLEGVDNIAPADKLRGHARFTGPHTLQVGDHTVVAAARVVIATGSTPIMLPKLRDVGKGVIVSDDVFEWTDLPSSVAVIGTGVIGLELGQALSLARRAGQLLCTRRQRGPIDRSRCAARGRADAGRGNRLALPADHRGGAPGRRRGRADHPRRHGVQRTERFQYVLVAAGRKPNVDAIGIEHTGLALDHKGIPLFDPATMQCGTSHIFIAGDANNERPVLPEAADHGKIAGDNAGRYPDVRPGLRRTPLAIAFTEPQIATLGETYRELCAEGRPKFAIGKVSFTNQGRSRVMLQNHGMLRVYGEYASGRFLGAEMIGPRAENLGHLLAWACQARLTVAQMLDMPFYHPVIEEGVRTALRDLAAELEKGAPPVECGAECLPGV
ncbi:dihydrolipoyl dehydrogenase [Massilia sp. H-1]|nr:dihydrolipoyl dehydrogenase [Massilia sp. H-1]